MPKRLLLLLLFLCSRGLLWGQAPLVVEPILAGIESVTRSLPPGINEAHREYPGHKAVYDSLVLRIEKAYPALAEKAGRKSALLNSLAGYTTGEGTRYLVPANPQMAEFFRTQQDRMDALQKSLEQQWPPAPVKTAYVQKGYLPSWDAVYRLRRPTLLRYRAGVLRLVQAEIAYLKANRAMAASADDAERVQYAEAEAKVLQQLIYLHDRVRKTVLEDGVEKVAFCTEHPASCQAYEKP
ncbi:MAG TPA: hypothetical protein VHK69_01150 [Chitinophagaceae bacterium]|jgi:hypothetical protein|nr:hypothetical protein [Chitinophagaceae bacterium]